MNVRGNENTQSDDDNGQIQCIKQFTMVNQDVFSFISHTQHCNWQRHCNALFDSYDNIQRILTPNLPAKQQTFLQTLFTMLTTQFQTLFNLTRSSPSSSSYQSIINSNLTTLSTNIASLLTYLQPKTPFLSNSLPMSFSIIAKPKTSSSLHNKPKPSFKVPITKITNIVKLNKTSYTHRSKDSTTTTSHKVTKSKYATANALHSRYKVNNNNTNNINNPFINIASNNNTLTQVSNRSPSNNKTQLHKPKKHLRSISVEDSTNTNAINLNNEGSPIFISSIHINKPKYVKKGIPFHCIRSNQRSLSAKRMAHSLDKCNRLVMDKHLLNYAAFAERTERDYDNVIGTKPSTYAKYLVQKYKDVVENYERIDTEEQKSNGKKVSLSKETNTNASVNGNCSCHSFGGSGIDLYDYLKRNKKKLKGCKYNLVYEGSNENREINANKGRKNVDMDSEKMFKKIQVIKRK